MKRRPPKVFSPDDHLQVTLAGVRTPNSAPRRWSLWAQPVLVARALMQYRYVDLTEVPPGRRPAAVRAQARAWSPFPETECRVLWFRQGAGIFAWDAARVRKRLAEVPLAQRRHASLVPDSAHIAVHGNVDGAEGARLVRGIEGFEGQFWKQGHLQSSRSWVERPDETEWLNFQRGAGVAPDAVRDVAASLIDPVQWSASPIARIFSPDALQDRSGLVERMVLFWGSLALMLATAVVARDYWDIMRRTQELKGELAQLEQAASANRETRDRALALRQQVEILTGAVARPNALTIQDHLLAHLPQTGTEIQDLTFDGSELRVVLKAPANIAREAVVKDLEQGRTFADVREARDSPAGTIALVMNVKQPTVPAEGTLAPLQPRPSSP